MASLLAARLGGAHSSRPAALALALPSLTTSCVCLGLSRIARPARPGAAPLLLARAYRHSREPARRPVPVPSTTSPLSPDSWRMAPPPNVAIIGAGSVGATVGAALPCPALGAMGR